MNGSVNQLLSQSLHCPTSNSRKLEMQLEGPCTSPLLPVPGAPPRGAHLGRRGQRVVQAQTVLPRRALAGAQGIAAAS